MGGFLLEAAHVIDQPYQLQATGQVGCFGTDKRDPLVVVKVGKIQRGCQAGTGWTILLQQTQFSFQELFLGFFPLSL